MIITTYNKIQVLDSAYRFNNLDEYEDSISKTNYSLVQLLLDKNFSRLSKSDVNVIKEKTEIKFLYSKDKRVLLLSWCVFASYQIPLCSDIVFFDGTSKIIALNGTGEDNDFGENIQIDSIYQIKLKNKFFYIMAGSNKCGNLCITQNASLYSVIKGRIVNCSRSFFDGKNYFDNVQFDYLVNENIKTFPTFKIEKLQLICPRFNKSKTKVIGSQKYSIIVK